MPGIWNVSNSYNLNNKKLSSKLTFEVGEKFNGKIISKGEENEVIVKLGDGWQFSAKVEGDIEGQENLPLQLQVEGYEDGKLKLKIVRREVDSANIGKDGLTQVLQKEGLVTEDIDILKKMIKHNMPLTRENINFIKSILGFNTKINISKGEVESFINKYLLSKGVGENTLEGKEITGVLKDFFSKFKEMNVDEILFFLENDIDLTSENIESYNKLFSSEETNIKDLLDNIKSKLVEIEVKSEEFSEEIIRPKDEIIKGEDIKGELIGEGNREKNVANSLISKLYDSNDISKGKVSMLSLLKSMVGGEESLLKEPIKDILLSNKKEFTTREFNSILGEISSLSDEDIINLIKENPGEDLKDSINNCLKLFFGKDINVTEGEITKIEDIIEYKFQDLEGEVKEEIKSHSNNISTEITKEIIKGEEGRTLPSNEVVKEDIKVKIENIKDIIKELLIASTGKGEGGDKVLALIKNNINDFKLFNTISNEYYYLDLPINREEREYPCKVIIKDNRKEGKKIDRTNVKIVVTVKTINIGTIDSFLVVRDNALDVELKCNKNYSKILELSKSKLINNLQTLGFNINIKVSPREEELTISSCREFFNDNTIKGIDIMV